VVVVERMPKKVGPIAVDLRQELARELAATSDQWTGIDLQHSVAFLFGRFGSHGGREYLEAKSFEERTGRQALARLLRSNEPLSWIVRNLLANLIDVESRDPRELCFKRRSKKRQPESIRDYEIAYFIAWQVGTGKLMKNAKADAIGHFTGGKKKVSHSTVNRAWSKHGAAMRDRVRVLLAQLKTPYLPR
jgi:hypothetical protein